MFDKHISTWFSSTGQISFGKSYRISLWLGNIPWQRLRRVVLFLEKPISCSWSSLHPCCSIDLLWHLVLSLGCFTSTFGKYPICWLKLVDTLQLGKSQSEISFRGNSFYQIQSRSLGKSPLAFGTFSWLLLSVWGKSPLASDLRFTGGYPVGDPGKLSVSKVTWIINSVPIN